MMRSVDVFMPPNTGTIVSESFSGDGNNVRIQIQKSENRVMMDTNIVRLEPRVLDVLTMLLEHAGQVVDKEALLSRVWGKQPVTDDALVRCISQIRKALNTANTPPPYIETIPRRGYKLIIPPQQQQRIRQVFQVAAIIALGVAGLVVSWLAIFSSAQPMQPQENWQAVRLTASLTPEWHATLAPDGSSVAYSGQRQDQWDIAVMSLQDKTVQWFGDLDRRESQPVFHPTKPALMFVSQQEKSCRFEEVDLTTHVKRPVASCLAGGVQSFSWHADRVIFSSRTTHNNAWQLYELDPKTGVTQPITLMAADISIKYPRLHRDGRLLFSANPALGVEDLYLREINGALTRLTADRSKIHGLDWRDDNRIWMSSNRLGGFAIWQLTAGSESSMPTPQRVFANAGFQVAHISAQNDQAVAILSRSQTRLDRFNLSSKNNTSVLHSSAFDWGFQPSPVGNRIAFVSDRSGSAELWLANADGSNALAVSDYGGPYVQTPKWSPDGTRIAYAVPNNGQFDIVVFDVDQDSHTVVAPHVAQDRNPEWTHSGNGLTFYSEREGRSGIWMITDLSSPPQFLLAGFKRALPADHQHWFVVGHEPGIFRFDGDRLTRLTDALDPVDIQNWTVVNNSHYFASRTQDGVEILRWRDQSQSSVLTLPDLQYKSGIWVSPDQTELLLMQVTRTESDVYLLEQSR